MCPKKLTRVMKAELSKKCKVNTDDYGYRRNTLTEIELVHTQTGETLVFNKEQYNLKF